MSSKLFETCLLFVLLLVPQKIESFRKSPSKIKRIVWIVVIILAFLLAATLTGLTGCYMTIGVDTIFSYLFR